MKGLLQDVTFLYGERDLSAGSNEWSVKEKSDKHEITNGASGGAKEFKLGLVETTWSFKGFSEAEIEAGDEVPMTVSRSNPLEAGDRAGLLLALREDHDVESKVGALEIVSASGVSNEGFLPAKVLAAVDGLGASAAQDAQEIGSLEAGEQLVFHVHLLEVSDEVEIFLESDIADDFSGSEVQRFASGPLAAVGAWRFTVSGPVTPDSWWRVRLAIPAGSVTARIAAGIESKVN